VNACIRAVGAYLPERRVANDDFSKTLETSDEWIYSHTGIKYRHLAADHEAASDLGIQAAKKALEKADLAPEAIDLIITATATADYRGFPSTACLIQEKIGAVNAAAFDITAACTGFIYGLEIAKNFIKADAAKNVLVIGTEVLSRVLDWDDRNTCVLFGDGAGAAIVTQETGERGILFSTLKAEGSDVLIIPVGGSRTPFSLKENGNKNIYLYMEGRAVYNFAVRAIGEVVKDILEKNNLSIAEISYIIPHQANIRIIQAAAKRLKISEDKFYTNMDKVANTSAASIPIALYEMQEENKLKPNDLIITVGFGGGLTYGGNLIRW
jgi:3-oxoacyl-[acyl-carrier-protein] synthase-3